MPKIAYIKKRFSSKTLDIIQIVDDICEKYSAKGFDLTIRQIYYQMVTKDLFPDDRRWTRIAGTNKWVRDPDGTKNSDPNYDWLGNIINNGRLAGILDWHSIVDRTRFIRENPHWESPRDIIEAAIEGFAIDKWVGQRQRIEVWIEKDALIGVITGVCDKWDVPYFSCRGYVSQSEMWGAAQRIMAKDVPTVILHLGDHDPSGIDMTRDIRDRIDLFTGEGIKNKKFRLIRIALNMEQIQALSLPPNPAKTSDSRCAAYIDKYGTESWELDALEPEHIAQLIETSVLSLMGSLKWKIMVRKENDMRSDMVKVGEQWDEIIDGLE